MRLWRTGELISPEPDDDEDLPDMAGDWAWTDEDDDDNG